MAINTNDEPIVGLTEGHSLLIRTSAKWKIPRAIAFQVIARDVQCIYCRHIFAEPYTDRATCPSWEHIVNDLNLVDIENIALCCVRCNASKRDKPLWDWLESEYCKNGGITEQSLAEVAIGRLQA
jgi:hypothetical protein